MTIQTAITMTIEQGLDFILSHFLVCSGVTIPRSKELKIWPRSISTKATEGRQILVYNKEEALARFAQANYLDCRISAYPPDVLGNPFKVESYLGIKTAIPTDIIVMIDLDRNNFKTDRGLRFALSRTLANIKKRLDAAPTILWSGRGYHIILPLNSNEIILENVKEFEGIPNISLKFLRYVESSLSLKKSDPQHNHTVSFNNCMLRIPGSINSKNGQTVKVIQKWDGIRPEINYLLAGFTRYIINEKYVELLNVQKRKRTRRLIVNNNNDNKVVWIERLLQTPISDHRKYCIWRILAPYLLNMRNLSYDESFNIIRDWLDRCNQLEGITFNVNQRVNEGLRGAERKGFLQISKDNLEDENGELHYLLQNMRTGEDVNFKMDWE